MKLIDNPLSPFALKVRIALYEKALAFETFEILTRAQREELLRIHSRGEVPALEDDGELITDSPTICQYLEAKYPAEPLFPREPVALSRCLSVQHLSDTTLDSTVFMLFLSNHMRPELHQKFPALRHALESRLNCTYERLEILLEEREYYAGDFSVADIALVPHFALVKFLGLPVDKQRFPRLVDWLHRMLSRPSVMRAMRELAGTAAATRAMPEPLFGATHIHWRDHRIECALRLGLGAWLHEELQRGTAFLPAI